MDFTAFMPYFWLALPILIAVLMAQRYNFILGFTSFFTSCYSIYFLIAKTVIVKEEMALSSGMTEAATVMNGNIIDTFLNGFDTLMGIFGVTGVSGYNDFIAWEYGYLIIFLSIQIVIQVFSSAYRTKKVRELKKLKKA